MKRIGITLKINNGLFANGVNQNALYLARVLKKCGYIVDLICADQKTIDNIEPYEKEINTFTLDKSYNIRYNVIIQIGLSVNKKMFSNWKKNNSDVKLIMYKCGNDYLVNTERMLFDYSNEQKSFKESFEYNQKPHQVWTIPQMEKINYTFYQFKTKQEKVTVVPFIWDPFVIEKSFEIREKSTYETRPIERCSIMEPHLSVMKNSILPIVILDKNQKINPFKHIYVFGCEKVKESKPYIDFVSSTELFTQKVISFERRYPTAKILPDYTDMVLSWQWENNLNYLWFDVAWMGYPVVHNGSMCQDVGYYYEGFDGDMAIQQINNVFKTHNDNHKEYLLKNREIIKRYTKENETLISQYKELIENVLNNKFERKKYNWQENKIY